MSFNISTNSVYKNEIFKYNSNKKSSVLALFVLTIFSSFSVLFFCYSMILRNKKIKDNSKLQSSISSDISNSLIN